MALNMTHIRAGAQPLGHILDPIHSLLCPLLPETFAHIPKKLFDEGAGAVTFRLPYL